MGRTASDAVSELSKALSQDIALLRESYKWFSKLSNNNQRVAGAGARESEAPKRRPSVAEARSEATDKAAPTPELLMRKLERLLRNRNSALEKANRYLKDHKLPTEHLIVDAQNFLKEEAEEEAILRGGKPWKNKKGKKTLRTQDSIQLPDSTDADWASHSLFFWFH